MDDPLVIGAMARMPNAALQPMEFLVGDWRTTGSHPMVPGRNLEGWTSFGCHEEGAFLVMRTQVEEDEFPAWQSSAATTPRGRSR